MIRDRIKNNKFMIIVLLCLVVGWLIYALFGHQLLKPLYQGKPKPLNEYLKKSDILLFRLSAIGLFSSIFLFALWTGKKIARKWFLCLLILFSLIQTSSYFGFRDLDNLPINDDHPRQYTFTVENAEVLIKYGTPYGFNHNFQGGIPNIYFKSCFLPYIPFSLFFGNQAGYQVMLIFFIVLIPISLFFLIFELIRNETIAQLASLISTFNLGLWHYLDYGVTQAVVALSLSLISLLFFLKYLDKRKYSLFFLLLFSGLVAYTHLIIFVITWMFFSIFFLYKLIGEKKFFPDIKKFILFCILSVFVCMPIFYNLFIYSSFVNPTGFFAEEKTLFGYIFSIFINLMKPTSSEKGLLVSLVVLFFLYLFVSEQKEKLLIRLAIIFSSIILVMLLLKDLPHFPTLIWKLRMFCPYIVIFNLSLFLLLRINKKVQSAGVVILLLIFISVFSVFANYLRTVDSFSEVDNRINDFILPGDHVLIENCAHFNPARCQEYRDKYAYYGYDHWLTYLQKDLGVRFFSHQGDDPHPFNNLRNMYVASGFYKGVPLSQDDEEEFIAQLKDWAVNKVCVFSHISKKFFNNSRYFKLLGESEKYTCYEATYNRLPEVRLDKGRTGQIFDVTPFSFTISLENVPERQTVIINKNYFRFWSAFNENGVEIPLRNCDQKICFDTAENGLIFFKYRKNILLNVLSVFALFLSLVLDLLRTRHSRSARRSEG